MSRIIRCEKGHYYDDDKFASCPHCGVDIRKKEEHPKQMGTVDDLDNMVTVAKHFFGGSRRRKKPEVDDVVSKPPKENLADQITDEMSRVQKIAAGLQGREDASGQEPAGDLVQDDQKTVSLELMGNGIEPVVGWLVCISGKERGRDFRLRGGFNKIGRKKNMDVVLSGDPSVSRDTHCSIAYDSKSNDTFLVPGKGTVTYYKGELLREAVKLQCGDEITIGESTFTYISFCGGKRSWKE